MVREPATVAGGDHQEAADEVTLGRAASCPSRKTGPVFVGDVPGVGVEGEAGAGFVLKDYGHNGSRRKIKRALRSVA